MATSPLFGWEEPDDVDLVKDGAAAIRTLGNAIDTSMGDLLGGTSGQVLSKNSNTNMDFTWVTPDDANAIQNAIVDAKGDLIAASAADTPARLAVGNNGETLVADSSTSTGLRYTAGTVQANPILNSAFQCWQRGTSIAISSSAGVVYAADRWGFPYGTSQAVTISRQSTGDTTNLPFIQYAARVQRNSGQTGTGSIFLDQSIETINSIPFAGKTVTFSFYARKGANYSATSSNLVAQLISGTGTDQNLITVTGFAVLSGTNNTLTTTWQRFTATATVGATATQLFTRFGFDPTGTAGANDYYEVTGVQIDIGSVALPFRTYAATIQGELAACQRYYYRQNASATNNYQRFSTYVPAASSTQVYALIPTPVTMRTTPTSVDSTTSGMTLGDAAGGFVNVTSIALDTTSAQNLCTLTVSVASGLTTYRPYALVASNSATPFIGLSAEL